MINVKDEKIKDVLDEIHEGMNRKFKGNRVASEEIVLENRIFSSLCNNPEIAPAKCAINLNNEYGYSLTGNEIIEIFRSRHMANPVERKNLFEWATKVSEIFAQAIYGKKDRFEEFEKLRKTSFLENRKRNKDQDRIVAIMIYEKYPEIDIYGDSIKLKNFGNTLGKYFFYDMADSIANVYGFSEFKEQRKKVESNSLNKQLDYRQAIRKIIQLENMLDRTSRMLQELQDEFEEKIEISKVKELTEFFSKLNSDKYGFILDELLISKKGLDELKKQRYELPIEINGLLIMVKKLIQFVRDCHIEPILKLNSIKEVLASDIEFFDYEGSSFQQTNEMKQVRVISPGWIYRDKEIQISRPKVKEENF